MWEKVYANDKYPDGLNICWDFSKEQYLLERFVKHVLGVDPSEVIGMLCPKGAMDMLFQEKSHDFLSWRIERKYAEG